ncbi:Na+/H+ antiporter NhaC [Haloimpatiens massiliensis]|uniref:Na+/H+ antiporter NhaC n=1 Tax=Haloimpatiens massiliensis TaxID=1658110 RepID=UPI000C83ECDF|nr:Na+/H+ antiporter NhaC [Haloimpatiens massiliensis]
MNTKKQLSFFEAISPILVMLLLLGFGYGYLHLKAEPLLILATVYGAFIAKKAGVTWDEMLEGMVDKIAKSMPATLILITVGILIGTWMFSGTIPMMIYYGIKIISPKYIIVTAFIVTAIISVFTGTSWGSVGTIGVAVIGIATALGVPLPVTAGAIVAGAYFGDKLSPLSDTTNLAPIAAGSELYDHIKHMLYTTVPAFVISLIIYTILGLNSSTGNYVSPEKVNLMLSTLGSMFNWNILLLVPVIIILYGSIAQKPTIPIMITSSLIASLLGIFYQGFSLKDSFVSIVNGFDVSMVAKAGFDSKNVIPEIIKLLNRGGMNSMMGTVLIAFCSFAFAGTISKAGCLDIILNKILKSVKTTGGLITSTVLSCIIMAIVTGSSYLSILIPGELFRDAYKQRGLAAKNLSRTLEDSGTVIVPLVPWSMAGVYMSSTLGVEVIKYAPWAFLCYLGFVFALLYGFTGFGIAKIKDSENTSVNA